jgi:hypothetical protein
MRAVRLVLVSALLLAAIPAAPAHAAYYSSCTLPPPFISGSLKVHDVGCQRAQQVVSRYLTKTQQQGTGRVTVLGFKCHQKGAGFVCHRDEKRIRLIGTPG